MQRSLRACVQAALRRPRTASAPLVTLPSSATAASRRAFVDTPMGDDAVVSGMTVPNMPLPPSMAAASMGDPAPDAVDSASSAYIYPLDQYNATFKMYGEPNSFANEDANRIFASGKIHSYDPTILFNDLRLQEVHSEEVQSTGGLSGALASAGRIADSPTDVNDSEAALRHAEDTENEAVMRSGRDKQVAGGAAAMAAAMLDSRRAVDGIALVPGHPLPVVFPRPDGLPPPLRFIKKFGPGGAQKTRAGRRVRQTKAENEEDMDATMYGEVMESEGRIDPTSLHRSIVWKVQVLDEHHRPTPVKPFQHFREAADVLPQRVMQGLEDSGFTRPTLLQSAAIPQLMRGRDVVGVSPDGSGTTVAYAVPSIAVLVKVRAAEAAATAAAEVVREHNEGASSSRFDAEAGASTERRSPSVPSSSSTASAAAADAPALARPTVVVICPTRQTVMRTAAMYVSLTGEDVRLITAYRTASGDEEAKQRQVILKKGCDVLVSTPARLVALMKEGLVTLDGTHVMAIDKANEILDAAPTPDGCTMAEHLETILRAMKENNVARQLSLWCSELVPAIASLTRRYLSPLTVTVMVSREEHMNLNVRQILYALPSKEERMKAIQRLFDTRTILKRNQVVVYCAYRETAEQVAAELIKTLSAPSSMVKYVHSGLRARKRNEVLKAFQHGDVRILVGTDVATKQLDVEELEHIIHYDLPASTEAYLQRVNQVGRSGRQGTSHTFLTPGDARVPMVAKFVERQTGHALSEEIRKMIAAIEATGGEDSWDTPVLRLHNRAVSNTKWRVRGRRATRESVDTLAGVGLESDEKPATPVA